MHCPCHARLQGEVYLASLFLSKCLFLFLCLQRLSSELKIPMLIFLSFRPSPPSHFTPPCQQNTLSPRQCALQCPYNWIVQPNSFSSILVSPGRGLFVRFLLAWAKFCWWSFFFFFVYTFLLTRYYAYSSLTVFPFGKCLFWVFLHGWECVSGCQGCQGVSHPLWVRVKGRGYLAGRYKTKAATRRPTLFTGWRVDVINRNKESGVGGCMLREVM